MRTVDVARSTNDLARELLARGEARVGDVVVAQEQSAGRGTGGKVWASPRGGLWMSVIAAAGEARRDGVEGKENMGGPGSLAMWPAVAVCDALRAVGVDGHVKWPNDVLVGERPARKIAGVLIEVAAVGGRRVAIVGVGVNVNMPTLPSGLEGVATSVQRELGSAVDLEAFRDDVLRRMAALAALVASVGLVAPVSDRSTPVGDRGHQGHRGHRGQRGGIVVLWAARCRMFDVPRRAVRGTSGGAGEGAAGERLVIVPRGVTDGGGLVVDVQPEAAWRQGGGGWTRETWTSAAGVDIAATGSMNKGSGRRVCDGPGV